jgi:hypothetical protein
MTQNELDAYKKAIKQKYETEKTGLYSSLLLQPSRANLRKLCVERFKENKSQDDATTFKVFFGFEFGEGNLNRLKSETDRFRALENFLKGTTDCNDIEGLNLIAILVNFTPRPFLKFAKNLSENKEIHLSVFKNNDIETRKNNTPITEVKSKKRKLIYGILGFAGLFSLGYTAKDIAFPKKECIQWQGNHYELMDCKNEANSFYKTTPIIPFDEKTKSLQRVMVSDTTTFFVDGKAVIWYCKVEGVPEYFNGPGFHPITGKALKPITKYMINKYVKK